MENLKLLGAWAGQIRKTEIWAGVGRSQGVSFGAGKVGGPKDNSGLRREGIWH